MPSAITRFAVLHHRVHDTYRGGTHFDLLLQWGQTLLTWEFSTSPWECAQALVKALPEHRLLYLDYSGPVSGNRGEVTQVDRGEVFWLQHTADLCHVRLLGDTLRGLAWLSLQDATTGQWQWVYQPEPKGPIAPDLGDAPAMPAAPQADERR